MTYLLEPRHLVAGLRRNGPLVGTAAVAIVALVGWGSSWAHAPTRAPGAAPSEASVTAAPSVGAFVAPQRTRERPPSAPVLELPAALANAPPLTADLVVRDASGRVQQRKRLTRSGAHLHLRIDPAGPEWWFVQNPVDARRVSAVLIEHARRTLVEYDESELSIAGIARGFADVVSLGVPPETFEMFMPGEPIVERFGHRFSTYRPRGGGALTVRELVWSTEAAAPLRLVLEGEGGLQSVELVRLSSTVVADLLRHPRERFPRYAAMDVADFREAHHEPHDHGSEPAAAAPGAHDH